MRFVGAVRETQRPEALTAADGADRFDGAIEDIFDLQDRVTASVVGAIAPEMEQAEIERASRKPTENLDAYDYYLQGMAKVYQATKHANDDALRLFYKAIELDPNVSPSNAPSARRGRRSTPAQARPRSAANVSKSVRSKGAVQRTESVCLPVIRATAG
jgi:hypothetical protein